MCSLHLGELAGNRCFPLKSRVSEIIISVKKKHLTAQPAPVRNALDTSDDIESPGTCPPKGRRCLRCNALRAGTTSEA
jgi:hypothetical protein